MDWASHMRRLIGSPLGENATFTHGAGSPTTVRIFFTNAFRAAELGQVGVSGTDPIAAAIIADIGPVSKDDTLVRNGITYKVKAPQPDEVSGVIVMQLKKP